MDIDAYLSRIRLDARPAPSLDGLRTLQRAHMLSVPFENLDVFLSRPLDLSEDALFEKVVTRRRGGYCFELNTLYAALLRSFGFEVRRRLARVWLRRPETVPALTHMALTVTLGGQSYLTDVGFGGMTTRVPVPFGGEAEDAEGPVRLREDERFGWMLERYNSGRSPVATAAAPQPEGWSPQFSVHGAEVHDSDVALANHFMQTAPESHFTQGRYVGLFTESGRDGLVDDAYSRRDGQEVEQRTVPLGEEWLALLKDRFGLRLNLTDEEHHRLTAT